MCFLTSQWECHIHVEFHQGVWLMTKWSKCLSENKQKNPHISKQYNVWVSFQWNICHFWDSITSILPSENMLRFQICYFPRCWAEYTGNFSGDKLSSFYTWNGLIRLWCNACTHFIILIFLPYDQLDSRFPPWHHKMAAVSLKLSWNNLKMSETSF